MKKLKNIICLIKFKYIFFAVLAVTIISSFTIIDRDFWSNFANSIRTTLESTKPTEELFEDAGRVKLINVLFNHNTCLVSTEPFDYNLKLSNYDNILNNDGCITVINASGILNAPYFGKVSVKHLADGLTEIKITHNSNFCTIFSGKLGLGVNDEEYVQKGQPIALLLGDLQFFISQNDEIVNNIDFSKGEILWKD